MTVRRGDAGRAPQSARSPRRARTGLTGGRTPTSRQIIIAIDGPAGSGKSTVARRVAERLGLPYIDTGAMYRALTFLSLQKKADLKDCAVLARLARSAKIELGTDGKVKVNGQDVTAEIRTPELTNQVHHVAACPPVRAEMVRIQRRLGGASGGVLEGRDIGTVVFPRAPHKFYLDADFKVRAERRYRELRGRGIRADLGEVRRDLEARDRKDIGRRVGALKPAPDARIVDTTALTIDQVADIIARTVSLGKRPSGRLRASA